MRCSPFGAIRMPLTMLHSVAILTSLAAGAFVFSAMHDIAFRTVPDWTSLALTMDGTALRLLDHDMPAGIACGAATFIVATLCWRAGWLGGGDVKLLAAVTMLVPPSLAVTLLFDVALSGGILALLYLALAQVIPPPPTEPRPLGLLRRICRAERYRISRRGPLPYASAIAVGAFLVMIKG